VADTTDRAFRFRLRIPICFRERGQASWRQGETQNISKSGVLFVSPDGLLPQSIVEMVMLFPVTSAGEEPSIVSCQGRIVRAENAGTGQLGFHTAATIAGYHFLRPATAGGEEV
jgi:hypothetical protein